MCMNFFFFLKSMSLETQDKDPLAWEQGLSGNKTMAPSLWDGTIPKVDNGSGGYTAF